MHVSIAISAMLQTDEADRMAGNQSRWIVNYTFFPLICTPNMNDKVSGQVEYVIFDMDGLLSASTYHMTDQGWTVVWAQTTPLNGTDLY